MFNWHRRPIRDDENRLSTGAGPRKERGRAVKAVILAAGEGKRFRPLTDIRPKPMLPVAGKPLLDHVVDRLAAAGIEEVVLVVGYQRERIQTHFSEREQDGHGPNITYAVQENPLGTGDALLTAEPYLGSDFLVVNGDRIVEQALIERLIRRREETGDQCMVITSVDDPTRYGMVELDGEYVSSLVEKPATHEVTSNLVNAGIYAFGPDIFAAIRQTERRGELKLTQTLADYLRKLPVRALRYDGLWLELEHPWDLLDANDGILSTTGSQVTSTAQVHPDATITSPVAIGADTHIAPGGRVLRGTTLGANVRLGANTVITNSVVFSDVTIGPGCVLTDCIIGEGATIGAHTTIGGGGADVVLNESVYSAVEFGGLIGHNATIGADVTLDPGAIVGNHTTVELGCTVSGRVENDTHVRRG